MRYALPFFPFAILGTAALAQFWCRRTWEFGAVVFGLILFAAISSLSVYPHSLSYFNEAAGGPENGSAHLLESNIDWGQDLLFLKRWLDEHPEAKPIGVAYFGLISPSIYGIESTRTPLGPDHAPPRYCGPLPGYYAISVNYLRGMHRRSQGSGVYEYFNHFSPIARVGYSLYIYRITPKQADQLRRQLGIDPSPP